MGADTKHDGRRGAFAWLLRLGSAAVLLIIGALAIYAFGAGYLSVIGLGVPSPWNAILSAIMFAGLLLLVWRIVDMPSSRRGSRASKRDN
jgi:hypothetical protein